MFAQRLRALRRGQNLTLKGLANGLNKAFPKDPHKNTSSQIGNWERGLRAPSYLEIKKLANFFDVSMDYIAGRTNINQHDLAKMLIANHNLLFNDQELNDEDQYQIYQLIDGYLTGKNHRQYKKHNGHDQQEDLNLNLK
ncbi:transcriptional regulator [Philodulcilactobacillus myokoensis]|uniref:Transcriptional regulator n=1 Tax=Philodulcilactobacillus myokoensis TaxID=2929573 RepID=A0A9W6B1S6_9LACO|nr:helix-turn-helix transcriptional regulator [Philodulcilactobacillus myokoensis]GLB47357.1 transcriptional regulator [Philodulcilactobacillus myokoensis]